MTYTAVTAKAFREKKGTLSEKLNTEFALIKAEYDTKVVCTQTPIDLSGAGGNVFAFVADVAYTLSGAYFVFTEASSADAGSNISVGKMFVGTDDVDFFVDEVATATSKETGYRQALTVLVTTIAAGDVIYLVSAGSKTGTGEGILQLLLTRA